jgi:very-short-patch-repair endonuclease
MLLIEFDGSYWRAEKAELDKAKAKDLRKTGWTVVRVREDPLRKLSK